MSTLSIPKRRSYRPNFILILFAVIMIAAGIVCIYFAVHGNLSSISQNSLAVYGNRSGSGVMTVDFLDVGQGSAALLCFPDGKTLMVDSGPPSSKNKLLSYLNERDVDALDCLVITHQHGDHAGNVSAVLSACTVKDIIFPIAPVNLLIDPARFEGIYEDIADKGLVIHNPYKGEVILSGDGYSVTVLSDDTGDYATLNDYSIILRVVVGNVSFLMMGDAEASTEQQLLHSGLYLHSDVLLVGHHGNRNADSIPFLTAVSPSIAVISVGENTFGQPSNSVISRLSESDIDVYRTDEDGTVSIETDGVTYKVDCGIL